MEVGEFESLMEGAEESHALEFKGPVKWSVQLFTKDILALSNIQDGGFIVVGIQDKTLERKGMTQEQVDSFEIEVMRDQLARYADPFVSFTCHAVEDSKGKKYIVIRVFEFSEVPVVCRDDGHDVKKGVLYFRSRRRRACSEPIATSYEMLDVLDRAVARLMEKRSSQGYTTKGKGPQDLYEEELGGL